MQEQGYDGLLIENNPAVADIQTVDSLVQHTTDGKKSYAQLISPQQTRIKILPCYCRYQRWKLKADSIRCYWCIISCSPSLDRGYYREGTISSLPCDKLIQTS